MNHHIAQIDRNIPSIGNNCPKVITQALYNIVEAYVTIYSACVMTFGELFPLIGMLLIHIVVHIPFLFR